MLLYFNYLWGNNFRPERKGQNYRHMVPTVLEKPEMSWNLNFVLEYPGKSLNLGEFEILSWYVLENIKIINET